MLPACHAWAPLSRALDWVSDQLAWPGDKEGPGVSTELSQAHSQLQAHVQGGHMLGMCIGTVVLAEGLHGVWK